MKTQIKTLLMIIVLSILFSCSEDDSTTNIENSVTNFKITVRENYGNNDIVYTKEYEIDTNGKVLNQVYSNFNNPEHNYNRTYQYNQNGKLLGYNGINLIEWSNNTAQIFTENHTLISECEFNNEKLTKKTSYFNGTSDYVLINYNANGNISSIENENGISAEYLNYDLSKDNPFNLVQSISLLGNHWKEYSNNIFSTLKVLPYETDDASIPLSFYDYFYTFNLDGKVIETEDEQSAIYTIEFEYE